MVKTSIRVRKTRIREKKRTMPAANAKKQNGEKDSLRNECAGFFATRAAYDHAERLPAMRMRMHAEQADAAAAALN